MYITCFIQTLLDNHEKLENEIKVYSSEIDRLKELSRQIFEFLMSGSVVRTDMLVYGIYCMFKKILKYMHVYSNKLMICLHHTCNMHN